jgi:hypothetical protein
MSLHMTIYKAWNRIVSSSLNINQYFAMKRHPSTFIITLIPIVVFLTISTQEREFGGGDIVGIADHSAVVSLRCWISLMLYVGVF